MGFILKKDNLPLKHNITQKASRQVFSGYS